MRKSLNALHCRHKHLCSFTRCIMLPTGVTQVYYLLLFIWNRKTDRLAILFCNTRTKSLTTTSPCSALEQITSHLTHLASLHVSINPATSEWECGWKPLRPSYNLQGCKEHMEPVGKEALPGFKMSQSVNPNYDEKYKSILDERMINKKSISTGGKEL